MLKFTTIREVWSSVEATDTETLLKLDDTELVGKLEQQVASRSVLTTDDLNILQSYISTRIPLIRDLAYSRLSLI